MANPILRQIREQARQGFRFYVYLLRKSDGTPFYVGKGTNRRVFNHERDAKGKKNHPVLNTIRKEIELGNTIEKEIESWHQTDFTAYEREQVLVQEIGCRYDGKGPLMNLRPGGSGGDASGLLKWRRENPEAYEASKQKIRETKRTEAYRMAASERTKKRHAENPELQRMMVEKSMAPEARKKLLAAYRKWVEKNPEEVAATNARRASVLRSDEFRKAQAERTKEWIQNHPEEMDRIRKVQAREDAREKKSARRLKWIENNAERAAALYGEHSETMKRFWQQRREATKGGRS